MTSPIIDSTFTTGTTITSEWLNGVNDALNDSTQDISGAVARTVTDKLSDVVSVKDFGAVGNGIANDTSAIQAAIDSCYTTGQTIYVPAGTYLITGIKIYSYQRMVFSAGAILKMSASGIAIRTLVQPGDTGVTGDIQRVLIENARIDMNSMSGFGILIEGAKNCKISSPWITNVDDTVFSYQDTHDAVPYNFASAGIVMKGVTSVSGCYYNLIDKPRVTGVSKANNVGIWMGTSASATTTVANYNQINQNYSNNLATGIDVALGGDNRLIQPEVSSCTTGIRVGNLSWYSARRTHRCTIVQPYMENCTTGIQIRNGDYTNIDGIASSSLTPTILDDSGGLYTAYFPQSNYYGPSCRFYGDAVVFPSGPADLVNPNTDNNALDAYQEYIFSPTLAFGGASTGITYDFNIGKYTRIGNMVFFHIRMLLTSKGSATGSATIEGMPFTGNSSIQQPTLFVPTGSMSGLSGTQVGIMGTSQKNLQLRMTTSSGFTSMTDANFTNTSQFDITGQYEVKYD